MKIGKPRYGSGKKNFKIKDGDNVYRILPPLGDCADKGVWNRYYRVEWGYKDSSGKNRPFLDCRVVNRKTKMVEVESAAHLRREQLIAKKKEMEQTGATPAQLAQMAELIKRYNQSAGYFVNAMNLQGEIGLLPVGYKAKLSLDAVIKELGASGIDPLGVNGCYLNFHRSCASGNFRDTITQVSPYKENVEVTLANGTKQIFQQTKMHLLDDSIIARLDDEAFELDKLYPSVTAAEVERMVEEGVPAIEEILGKAGESKAAVTDDVDEEEMEVTPVTPIQNLIPPMTPVTPVQQAYVPPAQPTVVAPAAPQYVPPVQAAPVAPKPAPVAAPVAPKAPVAEMSDEDFLKSIGA